MTKGARTRMSRRGLLAGMAAVPVLATPLLAAPGAARAAARVPEVVSARPHTRLTGLFDAYSDTGVGWTGADSTYSAVLPDGRTVWVFSDTFLGPVNPDGTRPPSTPFLNNSFVVQRGRTLDTVHGGTTAEPTALLPPPDESSWYWAGAAMRGGRTLDVVYHRFHRTGDGSWDFAWASDVLARFAPTDLSVLDVTDLPSGEEVASGSWLLPEGAYTYVYRVEDKGAEKYLHVARVHGRDLRRTWTYYTGDGWSPHVTDSARVLVGVSNEHSVTRVGPWYVLVTQDTTELFSSRIVAYFATRPEGPFEHQTLLYETPETGESGSYDNPNIYTYNPHLHPHLGSPSRWVLSYNVNSLVPDELYDDVTIYRPRFVEVRVD